MFYNINWNSDCSFTRIFCRCRYKFVKILLGNFRNKYKIQKFQNV